MNTKAMTSLDIHNEQITSATTKKAPKKRSKEDRASQGPKPVVGEWSKAGRGERGSGLKPDIDPSVHHVTDVPVCPYCGEFQEESDSFEEPDGEILCESCGKMYVYETEQTRTFTTMRLSTDCEHEGDIYCDRCGTYLNEGE